VIRVAHILPFMGVGGTEHMVLNLCKFRDRTKFECIVAAPEEGVTADEIRKTGTPVYTGPSSCYIAMRWADLINLHWAVFHTYWDALLQSSGKPYVTTLHSASQLPKLPFMTICTALHTYQIQKYKSRCIAIQNGIDLSRFTPRPKQQREEVVITRICRSDRCALYFWPAMRKVLNRYPQTRLWIVGNQEGTGRSTERVRFLGIRRDIPDILAETDIFAYTPYPTVGSSDLVVMEASAMGVPCVVSDANAVNESVEHEQNGFLTPFGDIDAFVQRIGMLVEDVSLRSQMGQTGIRIAQERFDMSRIARSYEAVYLQVLDAYHTNIRR
jgi:glycosyltransferase involved in cell wall biosynthesis